MSDQISEEKNLTNTDWDFTVEELRTAAKVARASGGLLLPAAASAWELRADRLEQGWGWPY